MNHSPMLVHGMTVDDLLSFHRARFGTARMEVEGGDGSEGGNATGADGEDGDNQDGQSFTQEDVNKLIAKTRAEEKRKASERFADYDDLKVQAGAKKSADDRIAALETEITASKHEALKRRVQAAHKISDEDADFFLTGTDEDTLTAQAKRLADLASERKKQGNHSPREGENPSAKSDPNREFLRALTGNEQ